MTTNSGNVGPSEFVSQAYDLTDEESRVKFYQKWAADYDHQMLDKLGYTSPATIARMLAEHLPDKKSRILDIGCGTGLTCTLLHQRGYTNLDGIDLSPDMLKVAKNRGIYQGLSVGDLNKPLAFESASYDAAISSGTFTHGHVGPEPLDEITRVLKPGAILAITIHHDLWQSHGFEAKLNDLVTSNTIECLSLEEDQFYRTGDPEGWFCVYRKC